jgi:hypothetical protein
LSRIDGLYPEQVIHNIIAEFNQKAINIERKKNRVVEESKVNN